MLKIIEKDIDQLIPYENNPRNNDGAVEAVAASIKNFGFKIPVVIDKDGVVVCGHTRIKSAKRLGMKKVPCIIADDLTDEQIRAFRLADNKTGELAEWDFERLRDELEALKDIDMSAFGFEDLLQEADELTLEDVEEDDFDEEKIDKEAPKAKRGDIYQLGDHRLMCGDSTNPDDLRELMGGVLANMVFTDPPYGVAIGDKNKTLNSVQPSGRCVENIAGDTLDAESLYTMLVAAFTNLRENGARDDCSYYVTSPQGGDLGLMMMMMMRDAGLTVRHMLIWVKNSATFSLGRLDYDYRHEPIFYTWTKSHNFYGGYSTTVVDDSVPIEKMNRKELIEYVRKIERPNDDSVIYCDKPMKCNLHPTMKPIKLVARFIINSSRPGDVVADIFGGSGSTIIAAEQTRRKCCMMELDPHYVDVIIARWEEFTGKKAELIRAGE